MSPDLALTIATPFVGMGIPALLIGLAMALFRRDPGVTRLGLSIQEDRSWREGMLRSIAAARLSDELSQARSEIEHRRARERAVRGLTARTPRVTSYIGRPPVTEALAA